MRHGLVCLGVVLLTGFSISTAQQQEKAKETAATTATTDVAKPATADERKNPVKATPEGMATVKKIYGYDCAMCHGAAGDGKGDVAASMNLAMKRSKILIHEPFIIVSHGDYADGRPSASP